VVISHGANSPRRDRSRFLLEFDWTGTQDPTAYLSVPRAIEFMARCSPVAGMTCAATITISRQRRLNAVRRVRHHSPCPDDMVGSLAAIPSADGAPHRRHPPLRRSTADILLERYGIEVPVIPWPAPPQRLLRLSAKLYNSPAQYETFAGCAACTGHQQGTILNVE